MPINHGIQPRISSDERWSRNVTPTDSSFLSCPQRVESEELELTVEPGVDTTTFNPERNDTTTCNKDIPIRMPQRRLSRTPPTDGVAYT
mmetsp:Transcript_40825/g.98464  ORF Transcript_40825/g.98464 Transcript_40825/m.98464 type:complete len:89 (-) Transcript_40825:382-648(-)